MARKVLIGFIGTGMWEDRTAPISERKYKKAKYRIEGQIKESSFISSVLADHIGVDCIYLIGTMKSMWEEVYSSFAQKNGEEFDDNYCLDLAITGSESNYETPISSQHLKKVEAVLGKNSKICVIKYGIDDEELMFNFEQIKLLLENLKDEDEIYLDITHAFRSIPLFATTVLMYINDVLQKRTTVKGVYYGMLDAMSEFNGVAPVVNLNKLVEIQNWIKGAYSFSNFGNGFLISDLLREEGNNENAQKIENLSKAIRIAYANDIKNEIKNVGKIKEKLSIPASLVIPNVIDSIEKILKKSKTDSQFQILLALWYNEKKLYSLSYILLAEAIVTFVCEQEGHQDVSKKSIRKQCQDLIYTKYATLLNPNEYYKTINEIRNNIAHASIGSRNSLLNDVLQLTNRIQKYKSIIFNIHAN